jgi:hypothetical protein
LNVRVYHEQQVWTAGVRLYSGSAQARLRAGLVLNCELTTRTENGTKLLPDLVCRLRVVQAKVYYDNLVVEHIAGVGGDAARLLGQAVQRNVGHLQPSLERRLLERAEAAILKAGDTKEVRIGLGRLLNGMSLPGQELSNPAKKAGPQ